jgi:hypothetical protein
MDGDGEMRVCALSGWFREVVAPHAGECASLSVRSWFSRADDGNGYPDLSFSALARVLAKMRSWSVVAPGVRPG